jgi:hypothetical protein
MQALPHVLFSAHKLWVGLKALRLIQRQVVAAAVCINTPDKRHGVLAQLATIVVKECQLCGGWY